MCYFDFVDKMRKLKLHNIYSDDYSSIVAKTLDNIASYSFVDKGYFYRRNIISEVDYTAVMRSEYINIRDYAGALLLEEEKTRLYYVIRVIKDYLEEGVLCESNLIDLPEIIQEYITYSKEKIIELYNRSGYSIVNQYIDGSYTLDEWKDLFLLIKKGHYVVSKENLQAGLIHYNAIAGRNYNSIDDISIEGGKEQYLRLIKRITFMEKSVKNSILRKEILEV